MLYLVTIQIQALVLVDTAAEADSIARNAVMRDEEPSVYVIEARGRLPGGWSTQDPVYHAGSECITASRAMRDCADDLDSEAPK